MVIVVDPWSAAISLAESAIERLFPDPVEKARQFAKLQELSVSRDLAELSAHTQLMLGQIETNKEEAKHKSIFIAGWRPYIGWVGGVALTYQFVLYPVLMWIWYFAQAKGMLPVEITPPPVLETGALFSLITGLLGLGAMRTIDKKNRTQTDRL